MIFFQNFRDSIKLFLYFEILQKSNTETIHQKVLQKGEKSQQALDLSNSDFFSIESF